MSFYLVYEALAAVLTAGLSLAFPQAGVQILAFVVFSLLGLTVLRPRTVQFLVRATRSPTQFYPDMVGRVVTVRERVTEHSGLVDAGGGEYWSARAGLPGEVLEPGTRAQVLYRDGIRLIVQALPPEEGSAPTLESAERPRAEEAPPADRKE